MKHNFRNEFIDYVSNTQVEIDAYDLSPRDGYNCDIGYYDDCVAQQRMLQKTNCSLPFDLGQPFEETVCQTFDEGVEVIKEVLTLTKKCKTSCLQIEVRYKEEPEHFLLAKAKAELVETFDRHAFGYIYHIPKVVKFFFNVHEYTAPVALGYFGSIVGIFIGVSIISILEIIFEYLKITENMRKWILIVANIVMLIYLTVIFGMLLMKYIEKPVANSIKFVKTTSDFSLSVCSLPYTYDLKDIGRDLLYSQDLPDSNFQLSNISFWQKRKNISTMIDTKTIDNGIHDIDLISDQYVGSRSSLFLPLNNATVAVCHTFDLSHHNTMNKINIVFNTEIEIYVHKKGQFLYAWTKKGTKVNPSSSENVKLIDKEMEVFDIDILLTIVLKHSVQKSSIQENFDDCFKAEAKKTLEIRCNKMLS